MIRDLSETLQAMLSDHALGTTFPELSKALIAFDRPDDTFKPSQTTINLFLYDVREDTELVSNEPRIERVNGQMVTYQAPKRMACNYLVTAWAVGGTDIALQEQRLITQVLEVVLQYPKIPVAYLKGKLVGQEPDLPLRVTPAEEMKNPSEFWAAVGNRLKPSVSIQATIAMDVMPAFTAPPAIARLLRVGLSPDPKQMSITPNSKMESYRVAGTVTHAGAPVEGATVSMSGYARTATTDADGDYSLRVVQAGAYVLNILTNGTTTQARINVPPAPGSNYDVQL